MNTVIKPLKNIENQPSRVKFIDDVVDSFLALKPSQNTRRAYSKDINDFLDDLSIRTLQDLANIEFPVVADRAQSYLNQFKKVDDSTGRVLNPKTINRKAYALSSFFKYLIDFYSYPRNPLSQYQALKVNRRSTTQSLTRAELIDVLALAKQYHNKNQTTFRDYLAICFMAILALRRQELVGLKWDDLQVDNQSIHVYQKGGSIKLLPIPSALYKLLTKYRNVYPSEYAYIFHPIRNHATGILNKPLNTNYIYQLVTKLVNKVCPDKRITPHSLRKSFIELALNNQEDFISIINATGHSTVEMIKYYDTRDTLKNNAIHGFGKLI